MTSCLETSWYQYFYHFLRVSTLVLKILISKKVSVSKILVENKASVSVSNFCVSKKSQSYSKKNWSQNLSEFSNVHWQTHSQLVAFASFFFSTTEWLLNILALIELSLTARVWCLVLRLLGIFPFHWEFRYRSRNKFSVSKKSQYWSQKFWSRR